MQEGGGRSRQDCHKTAFLVLNLAILQFAEGVQWFINGLFQRGGVTNFFEGGGGGGGGVKSIETHRTCDFPGGGGGT